MKLGEKLKQTLDELERAKINGIEAQHRADMEEIRKARADTKDWLDSIRETFVNQIEAGKVPLKKIENFDRQSWINKAVQGKAENQDLWNDFQQYWRSEGLDPEIKEAHDGMGTKSWINFTVKVLPKRPRSVSHTFRAQGPVDVVDHGVTGYLSNNLRDSIHGALSLDRDEVYKGSLKWNWEHAWKIFRENLVTIE